MAFSTNVLLAQVDFIISADDDELSKDARIALLESAIERYSHDLPDMVTEDITGDGGNYYAVATALTSWSEGFSRILTIEYPAPTVASDEAPVYLEPDDWTDDYWDGSTRYLYLPNHAPAATDAMRVRYTAPYLPTADAYDIPAEHFGAVCNLAAGLCAQAIANKYSRSSDSTIVVDSVNHMTRAFEWSQRAKELLGAYKDQLNIPADGSQPFSQFVDWDTSPAEGQTWLYH
jgi:hypothetical protein